MEVQKEANAAAKAAVKREALIESLHKKQKRLNKNKAAMVANYTAANGNCKMTGCKEPLQDTDTWCEHCPMGFCSQLRCQEHFKSKHDGKCGIKKCKDAVYDLRATLGTDSPEELLPRVQPGEMTA